MLYRIKNERASRFYSTLASLGLFTFVSLGVYGAQAPAGSGDWIAQQTRNRKRKIETAQKKRDARENSWFLSRSGMSPKSVEKVLQARFPKYHRTSEIKRLALHLWQTSQKYGIDPVVVLSVIHVESRFNPRAVSPKGARGLMQLMPETAEYLAKRWKLRYSGSYQLFDPQFNLTLGIRYLAWLKNQFEGHALHVLAAYNAGPTKISRRLKSEEGFEADQTADYFKNVRTAWHKMRRS